MTVIKYIIPEDGDDQAHPNVFVVSSLQPTLSDLKKVFIVGLGALENFLCLF